MHNEKHWQRVQRDRRILHGVAHEEVELPMQRFAIGMLATIKRLYFNYYWISMSDKLGIIFHNVSLFLVLLDMNSFVLRILQSEMCLYVMISVEHDKEMKIIQS